MNPTQILFNSVSGLTGGIVHDLQTAMVAVVAILFVLLGLDLLKDVLFGGRSGELNLETRAFDDEWDAAKYYHKLSKRYKRGSIEFDIIQARYRKHLKKLV